MEIKPNVLERIQKKNGDWENSLSPYACKNSSYKRKQLESNADIEIRHPFFRDSDRIIHSRAYTRYIDKTQVFFFIQNDHITHRVLHVQLVSKIGRTIGRALNLNEDLIEAISLGHDIGHVPFGHKGERILDKISIKEGLDHFKHNVQSVKWLDKIESLNLTLQVLDGILSHNGEIDTYQFKPDGKISSDNLLYKYQSEKRGESENPSTYEGAVVRFADNISYLARDLIDAIEINLLTSKEIENFPSLCKEVLQIEDIQSNLSTIQRITIDTLAKDIINNSFDYENIGLSDEMEKFLLEFKEYNRKYIYQNSKISAYDSNIEVMFTTLFDNFRDELIKKDMNSRIYSDFIHRPKIDNKYITESSESEIVIDFIAGMTDRYFYARFAEICDTPETGLPPVSEGF